ncbi:hypothetical protein HS048_09460 [Planomonospora sp. ID91781]|uniref:hypothetical protein n=1 Tax=Planomonospora sp. ID91781 TaxID=2738135 RepID=UPI0018C421BA|nr:hypothetical protein [Planomonospora sp. ID91781]MBG0820960.1 hypothetical protein [Planomonospora sp. ID91781]
MEMPRLRISTVGGGDSVPTLALLTRLAGALDASLTVRLDDDSTFVFTPHHRPHPDEASEDGRSSAA